MLFFILIKFSEENADQNTTLYLNFTHASLLESFWTIIPARVLFLSSFFHQIIFKKKILKYV
jgi:heme/copper-type cytochrome/quinol oxidase subunit 2